MGPIGAKRGCRGVDCVESTMAKNSRPDRCRPNARQESARQLRAILEAVDRGQLQADSGLAKRMLRRIEGAITALEAKPKRTQQR